MNETFRLKILAEFEQALNNVSTTSTAASQIKALLDIRTTIVAHNEASRTHRAGLMREIKAFTDAHPLTRPGAERLRKIFHFCGRIDPELDRLQAQQKTLHHAYVESELLQKALTTCIVRTTSALQNLIGRASVEDFIARMSPEEREACGMRSPLMFGENASTSGKNSPRSHNVQPR